MVERTRDEHRRMLRPQREHFLCKLAHPVRIRGSDRIVFGDERRRWTVDDGRSQNEKPLIVSAHLDTVFPASTPLELQRKGRVLFLPGISDNGAGIVALLWAFRAAKHCDIHFRRPVIAVGNVGEEGEGDLRGIRHLFSEPPWDGRECEFISVDGAGLQRHERAWEQMRAPALAAYADALGYFADAANALPGFRMFTIVLGVNPINMSRVDRSPARGVAMISSSASCPTRLRTHSGWQGSCRWRASTRAPAGNGAGSTFSLPTGCRRIREAPPCAGIIWTRTRCNGR